MSSRAQHPYRQGIIAASITGVVIAVMLFVFSVFEEAIGHSVAIASFAATAAIVAFHPTDRGAHPKTVIMSYLLASLIGYGVSVMPVALAWQAALSVGGLLMILSFFDRVHPPAVAYVFGFILGGYGLREVVLTVPALLGFFVALSVTVFCIERVAVLLGLIDRPKERTPRPKTFSGRVERVLDVIVPYALVLLFLSLLLEFVYYEQLRPYAWILSSIDWSVIVLFAADLSFKFRRAKSSGQFFSENWLDILATIPFFILFRAFQGAALAFQVVVVRGAADAVASAAGFARFLRPLARFPRFARMLERMEGLSGEEERR